VDLYIAITLYLYDVPVERKAHSDAFCFGECVGYLHRNILHEHATPANQLANLTAHGIQLSERTELH
jgi:hypothetical protein